ncbi:MAG: molybdopterin-dependent oxidoreductase [Deltaproteobacteria bacterium]|nr:molybdopterin-dependent oxidoreductase [Deltaproteobacteria bacterium]
MAETRRTYCGLCHPRCGLLFHIEDGRAVKVEGDPKHPISRGRICARGTLMIDHLYHPDRLNYPLKRTGERGEGKWERISWDQALDVVAQSLETLRKKYGPETLAFTHGTYRTYHWDGRRFFNLFGSPNMCGANNICMCPSQAVEYTTYGGFAWGDLKKTRCVVLWGSAPSKSNVILLFPAIQERKKAGMKMIVVDPRRTAEAEMADIWLQIRPGTDLALMLGWIRIIIKEGLFDRDFVEKWTVGFDQLRNAASEYTPEKVAAITWLEPNKVIESARFYAENKPAVISWGFGIDKQGLNASQSARARSILRAITGNLDVEGGELLGWSDPVGAIIDFVVMELNEALSKEQRSKQLGAAEYPFFGFPGWEMNLQANKRLPSHYMHPPKANMTSVAHGRAVMEAILTGKPYPVTAMISLASNPLLSLPNTRQTFEALKSLRLYVVSDYYLTPSAALADYVFPAASTVERDELWLSADFCIACPKGVEPLYERRDDYQFWRSLGLRLGQEEYWPWPTVKEAFDHRLAPVGLTFEGLLERNGLFGKRGFRRYEEFGFGTPSGKVEIYSSIFEKLGLRPLPAYQEPLETPENALVKRDYPLVLITGSRFMPMYHSEQRQIRFARKIVADPLVNLHPDVAKNLGLKEGEWVYVVSPRGRIRLKLHLSEAIHPQMADVQHGWWFPERKTSPSEPFGVFESNANILCPDEREFCSPEIGGWPHTALMCRIEKA